MKTLRTGLWEGGERPSAATRESRGAERAPSASLQNDRAPNRSLGYATHVRLRPQSVPAIDSLAAARNASAQLAAAQPDNVAAQVNAIRLLDDPRRMADLLAKLARLGEASAAQSLATGELLIPIDGKPVRYRYTVHGIGQ